MDDSAIIIVATESGPKIQTHIDGVVVAQVAVSNNTSAGNTVLGDGDLLAAKSVVLSRTVLVKETSRHGDEGGVGVDVLEVGADTASTVLAKDAVALVGITEAVDGAVGVVLVDAAAASGRRVGATTAVLGTGTAVAVLRAALASSAWGTSVAAVVTTRGRAAAAAVVGASATVAVLGAALAGGAVRAASALALSSEKLGRSGSNGRSHGEKDGESRLLHCDGWSGGIVDRVYRRVVRVIGILKVDYKLKRIASSYRSWRCWIHLC